MRTRRRRLFSALAGIAVFLTSFSVIGMPTVASADPDTVAEAKAELDKVQAKAAEIDASYAESTQRLTAAQQTYDQVSVDLVKQRAVVDQHRQTVAQVARANYQNSGFAGASSFLFSSDDSDFIQALATRQSISSRTNAQLQNFQEEQGRLLSLEAQSEQAIASIKLEQETQQKLMKEYDEKEAKAKAILARLTQEQQQELFRRQEAENQANANRAAASREEAPFVPAPDGSRASTIVAYGMAQVGKNYRMGGTGPSSYDCSGLAMMAYRQAGISIPRTAGAQYRAGTKISVSQLQPGDLVFYYSGIGHVGIYIGNGKIVHAANPRRGIRVAGLYSMPLVGAARYA